MVKLVDNLRDLTEKIKRGTIHMMVGRGGSLGERLGGGGATLQHVANILSCIVCMVLILSFTVQYQCFC
jgi:hypothetical protein